jgi:hypothetical protein
MIKKFGEFIKESVTYKPTNLIQELCVSMVLLNNEFLDPILDKGNKGRYSEDSSIFLTDLKGLLINKNRLKFGKFEQGKCVEDVDLGKINEIFEQTEFSIEDDWNVLINSRNVARAIIDKLIPDGKLTSDMIDSIYYIGPNKDDDHKEDIVIQTKDDKQYSIFLNKKIDTNKSASFNKIADDIIGDNIDLLYKDKYYDLWTDLTQSWVKLVYENAKPNVKALMDKFIVIDLIDKMKHFDYFNIKHRNAEFKNLGEHIKEYDKNILKFNDLMSEIWKDKENSFTDFENVVTEWNDIKKVKLCSKILENLLTTSILNDTESSVTKLEDGYKQAEGKLKMKLIKTIVNKMGCLERDAYFVSNDGKSFEMLPTRKFFRDRYDKLSVKFDYHVRFDSDNNGEFPIKLVLSIDDKELVKSDIYVKFSGSEMSGKLTAKYKFDLAKNFNHLITEI